MRDATLALFVPGRVCLFGEHSDWAGGYRRVNSELEKGYVLVIGINQGIYAEVKRHPTKLVVTSAKPNGEVVGPYEIPMESEILLKEAQKGSFFSYISGVAHYMMNYMKVHLKFCRVEGLEINNFRTTLPMKKGLSSSAAICVLTARAFNLIYKLGMSFEAEMEAAYQGEITTPSRCGRMDQACAFGSIPVSMIFDGDKIGVEPLMNIKEALFLVIVDLLAGKDTKKILADLNRCYPFAQTEAEKKLHEYLGKTNKEIVASAAKTLSKGDSKETGRLMTEAQRCFDEILIPCCPSQLKAPVLHKVLEYSPIQNYIWGGKGVGSGGDGSAQLIAKDREAQKRVIEIIQEELNMPCLELTIPSK